MNIIQVFAIFGLCAALYGFYVERNARENEDYRALCDLHPSVSCSKVLTSRYSNLVESWAGAFGVRHAILTGFNNLYLGICFYTSVLLRDIPPISWVPRGLFLLSSTIGAALGLYFYYVMYFVLEDLCLVCLATNTTSIILCLLLWRESFALPATTGTTKKTRGSKRD